MGDINGFLKIKRKEAGYRPVHERIYDYSEVEQTLNSEDRMMQASRCMDCGIPFCHWACPISNKIPEWNDLLYRGQWKEAYKRLTSTNNFPEFTGRICPAPCEHSCVLALSKEPVTIRENEAAIIERAFAEGYVVPNPPKNRTGKSVAVIGSGPAGMAAADLLNKWGHTVTLFEKDKKVGGLLRYGIPDFKLSKTVIDRRLNIMIQEGLKIKTGINVGVDITAKELLSDYDAICVTIGAGKPRDLNIEGRNNKGIFYAMEFLAAQNRIISGEQTTINPILSATGKDVLVIGGGDTGSDCVGTSKRQGAKSITQIEILPKPPVDRSDDNPWPYYAKILKTSSSHEEGCIRLWSYSSVRFLGESNNVTGVEVEEVEWTNIGGKMTMSPVAGTKKVIKAQLVLLALGFVSPVTEGLIKDLGVELDYRNNVITKDNRSTNIVKVFAAGDTASGASLVVRAMDSGRVAAQGINDFLNNR
jgi:glutamate synthase (NADPH/NADH) small chain